SSDLGDPAYDNTVTSSGGAGGNGDPNDNGQSGTASGPNLFGPSNTTGNSCDPLVVNDVGDAPAVNPSAGCATAQDTCTLRAAIQAANASFGALTKITFDITGQSGIPVISPQSPLPAATVPLTIDGTSQPGSQVGQPGIRLDGASAGKGTNGLELDGQGSAVDGLDVTGFDHDGILLKGNNSQVTGSWIGVASAGGGAFSEGPNRNGIEVASSQDVIGGTTAAARDVISGNGQETLSQNFLKSYKGKDSAYQEGVDLAPFGAGVLVQTTDVSGLTIQGDYIGTAPDGNDLAPGLSQPVGILVVSPGSVSGVTIGGPGGAGNDISGNLMGVLTSGQGLSALSTVKIDGNLIGPVGDGTASKNEFGNGIGI